MNAQVYYRKWRPRRFADLVGQEPVARTLKQAVARNRIAHAYLFCGPRGTGKTSTARILAKAANCLAPVEGEPCNQCRMCLAFNEGRFLDLIEIDAASNRRLEEMRDLREKVHYSPSEGKYKVYVLDEVHMLTNEAEAALLKTLEEPPPHVIFILATTDPQKLNDTIVSRCQRFDFKRISVDATVGNLAHICEAEGIQADPAALRAIARNADGSMRDAEGLLEQAVTSFGSPLTVEQVRLLLGLADDERVRQLVGQVLLAQVPEALTTLSAIAAEGLDLHQLHRQLVDEVRDLLLLKAGAGRLVPQQAGDARGQAQFLQQVPMERLLHALRQFGQVTFRPDAPPTLSLELAIIEATQDKPVSQPAPALAAPAPAPVTRPLSEPRPPIRQAPPPSIRQEHPSVAAGQNAAPPARPRPSPTPAPDAVPQAPDGASPEERLQQQWEVIMKNLTKQKWQRFNVGALLRNCRQHRLEDNVLYLEFTHQSHQDRMKDEMENPDGRRRFLEAVSTALGASETLRLEFIATNTPQRMDKASRSPMVQAALSMGGRIVEETEEHNADE